MNTRRWVWPTRNGKLTGRPRAKLAELQQLDAATDAHLAALLAHPGTSDRLRALVAAEQALRARAAILATD